ncbi:MAG: 4a-hydroxytetrahydrobiopterin dehydratase [Bacteroidetes bacterium]|jgi:4a-hydroxytetrahydrobiopterin dehydratase|nr:4a-hydroxytetrahydrobiopterin dehydratase [Bacteroidota bacterium]
MELSEKKCVPCEGGVPPLKDEEAKKFLNDVHNDWQLQNNKIVRKFSFVNFVHNMDFVNKVAELAEAEGHHPDMHISYAQLTIELSTHAIGGLSENDFILAAKIDKIS